MGCHRLEVVLAVVGGVAGGPLPGEVPGDLAVGGRPVGVDAVEDLVLNHRREKARFVADEVAAGGGQCGVEQVVHPSDIEGDGDRGGRHDMC